MTVLRSAAELQALLGDRPDQTHTYQISPASADDVTTFIRSLNSGPVMRDMSVAEIEELARYLDIPPGEFYGTYSFSDCSCTGCGRHLTLMDMAKTGVDRGFHSKEQLAAVLTGKAGQWVTVRGRDGGREINCSACGQVCGASAINYLCFPVQYFYAY
ncbi:MAG TPA: hypothetical protein VKS82_13620 [Streptosporangiaceae bacterium]|nr:hypothetical protein [Streptosporangiaceae bacterium]